MYALHGVSLGAFFKGEKKVNQTLFFLSLFHFNGSVRIPNEKMKNRILIKIRTQKNDKMCD